MTASPSPLLLWNLHGEEVLRRIQEALEPIGWKLPPRQWVPPLAGVYSGSFVFSPMDSSGNIIATSEQVAMESRLWSVASNRSLKVSTLTPELLVLLDTWGDSDAVSRLTSKRWGSSLIMQEGFRIRAFTVSELPLRQVNSLSTSNRPEMTETKKAWITSKGSSVLVNPDMTRIRKLDLED